MTTEIRLTVPSDFTLPSIMRKTTPEENAMILSAGPAIHRLLMEMNFTQRISDLEDKLRTAKANERAVFEMEERITEAINDKLGEVNTDILSSFQTLEVKPDTKLRRDVENLSEKISKLDVTQDYYRSVEQCLQRLDQITHSLSRVTVDRSSSVIGRDNEVFMEKLLIETFATHGAGFELIDKRCFSGDHIFRWNGFTIMVEDKKYKNTVPFKETSKAVRDFNFHPECDILLMISMDTAIRGHETSSDIDSAIFDNRLVLFVSNFAEKGDLHLYIRRVIQPILMASKPMIKQIRNNPEKIAMRFQTAFQILPTVMSSINDQENILIRHIKDVTETVNAVHRTLKNQRCQLEKLLEIISGEEEAVCGTESMVYSAASAANGETHDEESEMDDEIVSKPIRNCSKCGKPGHDSRTCKAEIQTKSKANQESKVRTCGYCKVAGHDKRICPKYKADHS